MIDSVASIYVVVVTWVNARVVCLILSSNKRLPQCLACASNVFLGSLAHFFYLIFGLIEANSCSLNSSVSLLSHSIPQISHAIARLMVGTRNTISDFCSSIANFCQNAILELWIVFAVVVVSHRNWQALRWEKCWPAVSKITNSVELHFFFYWIHLYGTQK